LAKCGWKFAPPELVESPLQRRYSRRNLVTHFTSGKKIAAFVRDCFDFANNEPLSLESGG
jgi:hypothetical protein